MAEQNIHRFTQAVIPLFQNCEFCGEKILSIFNSAFQCSQCLKFCHRQCCQTADSISPCLGTPDGRSNQEQIFASFPVNHSLAENSSRFIEDYLKPQMFKKDSQGEYSTNAITRSVSYRATRQYDSDNDSEDLPMDRTGSPTISGSESRYCSDPTRLSADRSNLHSLYTGDSGIISRSGFLTVIIQQASQLPDVNGKMGKCSIFCKVSLQPWGNECFNTTATPFNDGYPDWDGHNNTLSFEYPGALPNVNPLIRISIKGERPALSFSRPVIGVVQVPLRKIEIEANRYNDNWYPLYREGKKTDGKVRVSFMLCSGESMSSKSGLAVNPQKPHYFEKQTIDTNVFSSDCPVCKKSLISGLGNLVNTIEKCKVCGMTVHGSCREKAKRIFVCRAVNETNEKREVEDIGAKLLRSIKKDRLLIYDQPIGYLQVIVSQITLFNLRNKHKLLYLQLSCDQNETSSSSFPFSTIMDFNTDEFCFSWPIFDPMACLRITIKDKLSLQTIGYMKVSIQEVLYSQSEEQLTEANLLNPLSVIKGETDVVIKTYDIVRKNVSSNVKMTTTGSISVAISYQEDPRNLFSKQTPALPPIPEMLPAVMSALWVRLWQIAKIYIDLFDMAVFAVSWEIPPLSLAVTLGYFGGIMMFSLEYIHLYIMSTVILVLCVTFVLRKKRMIAKTIQTNSVIENSSYFQITSAFLDLVNTPVNQVKNSLAAGTLVLFLTNLVFVMTEKVYHLAIWTHPEKTRYFLRICILIAIILMIIPLKLVLIVLGCCFLFPKKFSLLPYINCLMNFVNSLPDDDMLICPPTVSTVTADGLTHSINKGYCRSFFSVMAIDENSSLWKKIYISIGYDGIVRKWNNEAEVTKMKGVSLFRCSMIESVNKQISYRDFARFGVTSENDWTAGVDNSVMIHIKGRPSCIVLSLKNTVERDEFLECLNI